MSCIAGVGDDVKSLVPTTSGRPALVLGGCVLSAVTAMARLIGNCMIVKSPVEC